jgi:hypothetical protein
LDLHSIRIGFEFQMLPRICPGFCSCQNEEFTQFPQCDPSMFESIFGVSVARCKHVGLTSLVTVDDDKQVVQIWIRFGTNGYLLLIRYHPLEHSIAYRFRHWVRDLSRPSISGSSEVPLRTFF